MTRFSGCCDWGFDLIGKVETNCYFVYSAGSNDSIREYLGSTGAEISTLINESTYSHVRNIHAVDSAGNFYALNKDATTGTQITVRKVDSSGTELWSVSPSGMFQPFRSTTIDQRADLYVDGDSNVYVCGRYGSGSDAGAIVGKYDSDGNEVWLVNKVAPDVGSYDQSYDATGVAVDLDGNVHVCGMRFISDFSGQDGTGRFHWHLDSDGNEVWNDIFSGGAGTGEDYPIRCQFDESGNVYANYALLVSSVSMRSYDSSGTERFTLSPGTVPFFVRFEVYNDCLYLGRRKTLTSLEFSKRSGSSFGTEDWLITKNASGGYLYVLGTPHIAVNRTGDVFAIGTRSLSGAEVSDRYRLAVADGSETWAGSLASDNTATQSIAKSGRPPHFI